MYLVVLPTYFQNDSEALQRWWNEKDITPLTETQAILDGWQRVNQNCDDDKPWPGYRYENPDNTSYHGLVLIFDELENLVGVQLALPQQLVNLTEYKDRFAQSEFYILGLYNGAPAYLLTYYAANFQEVCQPKQNLCINKAVAAADVKNGPYFLTKTSWIKLHELQDHDLAQLHSLHQAVESDSGAIVTNLEHSM